MSSGARPRREDTDAARKRVYETVRAILEPHHSGADTESVTGGHSLVSRSWLQRWKLKQCRVSYLTDGCPSPTAAITCRHGCLLPELAKGKMCASGHCCRTALRRPQPFVLALSSAVLLPLALASLPAACFVSDALPGGVALRLRTACARLRPAPPDRRCVRAPVRCRCKAQVGQGSSSRRSCSSVLPSPSGPDTAARAALRQPSCCHVLPSGPGTAGNQTSSRGCD